MLLAEAFLAGDDHGADGVGARDVRVVVDLDAAWRLVETEEFGDALEQRLLRRAFGELAAERLAGIVEGVVDEVALFAALRDLDIDAAAEPRGQRFLEHGAVGRLVAEQHELGRLPVLVELAHEGFEHFGVGEARIGLGAIGVVAPVLVGAEEEDLDAELAGLVRDGEDVGLLDAARDHVALALHQRERAEPVAQQRGALEVEASARLVHFALQMVLHGFGFAAEELPGLVDQLAIGLDRDLAGAGRGAALDLVQHAGPGAGPVEAVRAGAQQERLLQRRDGALHRAAPRRTDRNSGPACGACRGACTSSGASCSVAMRM